MTVNYVVVQLEETVRGEFEKFIDRQLDFEVLSNYSHLLEEYKPLVKSIEDAMFGFIIAAVLKEFVDYCVHKENRYPNEAEKKEINDILKRRAPEIQSKILLVLSK